MDSPPPPPLGHPCCPDPPSPSSAHTLTGLLCYQSATVIFSHLPYPSPYRQREMQTDDAYMIRVMHVKNANGESRTLQFPMRLDLDRPKRARTTFSEHQLRALDNHYRRDGYVTGDKRVQLAESLGLTDTQVKVWFQNRRTKDRKRKGSDDEEPARKQRNNAASPSPSSTSCTSSSSTDLVPPPSTMNLSAPPPIPAGFPLLAPHQFLSIPDFALFPFAYPQGLLMPQTNLNA